MPKEKKIKENMSNCVRKLAADLCLTNQFSKPKK